MSKLLAVLIAGVVTVLSTSAFAEGSKNSYISELYSLSKNDVGPNQNTLQTTIGHKFDNGIGIDIKSQFKETNGPTRVASPRLEGGVSYGYKLTPDLSLVGRVAYGEKLTKTTGFEYWSVEPGIKYRVNDALGVKVGYRLRDSLDNKNADRTQSWKFSGDYALTKDLSLIGGYSRIHGDQAYDELSVGASYRF